MRGEVHQTEIRAPGRRLRGRLHGLLAVLFAVLAWPATAQPTPPDAAEVSATFRQRVCYLGDQTVLEIAVENVDEVEPPDLSGIGGAEFEFRGTSDESRSFYSNINGKVTQEVTKRKVMRWVVTPTQAGTLRLPPIPVRVDGGRVFETAAASLRVLEPERAAGDMLRVEPERTDLYINQPTRVKVTWVLTGRVESPSFRGSEIDDGLMVQGVGPSSGGQPRRIEFDIFGTRTIGRETYVTRNGRRTSAVEFEVLVTPTRAGEFEVGPVVVSYDERVSRRSTERKMAEAGPVTLTVRELPTEGQPENFDGLLGTHGIEANASPTTVSVGDPITLEVAVFGPEPLAGVTDGPDLESIPAFAERFRFSSEGWTMSPPRTPGERRFTTTIRAASGGVDEIPSIPLPFFDPDSGEYHVARSEPIPLEVRAVCEVTAADAVVSSGPAAVSREPLTETRAGLWAIDRGPAVLADTGGLSDRALRDPVVLTALLAPPGAFAVVLGSAVRRSRRADEATRRRRAALASAKKALHRDGAAAAVRVYLAEAFGATPSAITGADGRRLLAEAGVSDADAVAELIAVHEAERYAGAGRVSEGGSGSDNARVLELLRRVHRSIGGTA